MFICVGILFVYLNIFEKCVVLYFDDFDEEISFLFLFLYFYLLLLLLCFGLFLLLFLFYKFG